MSEDKAEKSLEELKKLAAALRIAAYDQMSREELLHAIHKAQGGDGGLTI